MEYEKKHEIDQRVYSAEDIQMILGVKRSAAYNFLTKVYKEGEPFLVHKSGPCTACPRRALTHGCAAKKNEKLWEIAKSIEKVFALLRKSLEKVAIC